MTERFVVHLDDLRPLTGNTLAEADGTIGIPIGSCIVANGCFDGLHPGHLSLLATLDTVAYQMKLRPIIAINSDASALKGDRRPINSQVARASLLTHLKWPFTVVIFDEDTPQRLMDILRPTAVMKGSEHSEESVVRWRDSQVITVDMVDNWSTSRILGDTR